MADVSGKDLRTAERRIARIAHHLLPLATPPRLLPIQRSVASANDSYRRVHGEVSTRDATWIPACDESGKEYTDIIYEKAVGEGIAKVGSFDAGYGSSIMSRLLERLELETLKWSREILRNSPTAIRVLKSALNAVDDGHAGLQLFSKCGSPAS
ncbi:hypothetical protein BHE74_00056812 [Ensete ventricosum]|nr:hypothetical protein BHE74_00056812 [Ensete ventricosum]